MTSPRASFLPANRRRRITLLVLSIAMVAMGILHFSLPGPFVKIVPPFFPEPRLLVYVSGFFEVLGGVGVLLPVTRRAAAWGLVALFVAVFPANVYMAVDDVQLTSLFVIPAWLMWVRLPIQGLFIAVACRFTREEPAGVPEGSRRAAGT